MARAAEAIEIILHRVEQESHKYALNLNQNKCIHIQMDAIRRTHFRQGNAAPMQNQVDYLGKTQGTTNPNYNTE